MLGTVVNALAIIIGSAIGLLARKGLSKKAEETVYVATGVLSLVIGLSMAIKTEHVLSMALSLILGGLAGTALNIEGAILRLGEWLKDRFDVGRRDATAREEIAETDGSTPQGQPAAASSGFAFGFLNASVLFCVGALALVGSFKAGTEGDYDILFTKSVMDGFVSMIFAGAMGIGVAFSAVSVFVYQGILTLAAVWVKPFVSPVMINELSAVGGALVTIIAINVLGLRKIRTGDFLPALAIVVVLSLLMKYIPIL